MFAYNISEQGGTFLKLGFPIEDREWNMYIHQIMLTNKAKKQILMSVLETVEHVSNKEYQKRVWIQGEGAEVDDFDETCCNFFGEW